MVFSNLDLTVLRLGNTYEEDTQIQIESLFMGVAPFEAKWTFSPKRSDDSFRFKGAISELPLAAVVPFTLPNARIRLDGKVDNLVFDITGNQWESHTVLTGKYRNVKIHMENRRKGKERELLSGWSTCSSPVLALTRAAVSKRYVRPQRENPISPRGTTSIKV